MRFSYLRQLPEAGTLPRTYKYAFRGTPLDDRGTHSCAVSAGAADAVHEVEYDVNRFQLVVGGTAYKASEAARFVADFGSNAVLLDATTLDFPELLLLTQFFIKGQANHIGYLYVEPGGYREKLSESDGHAFELSDGYSPFHPIPGFTPVLSPQTPGRLLAFLGFESGRLSRVLSPDESAHIRSWSVAFGVPPFQASWEMHSIMQNIEVLEDAGAQQGGKEDVHFVGANDPLAAYDLIASTYAALQGGSERLVMAPLGTKPATISVALFAATHPGVRLMFDYPLRRTGRTQGVGRVHHYGISLR